MKYRLLRVGLGICSLALLAIVADYLFLHLLPESIAAWASIFFFLAALEFNSKTRTRNRSK